MKKLTVTALLILTTGVFCQECDKYKAKVDSLMAEFNAIKEKMQDPGITRDVYDDLYSIYTDSWDEIVETQKEQKKCLESQKKTVKVKVEPKKVDKDLPQLFNAKWASARQTVKDALRKQSNLKLAETDDSVLEYKGGKYLGSQVEKWQFNFISKKLYACQIVFQAVPDKNALKLYDELSRKLIELYGEPSYEKNRFPSSYKDDKIRISSIMNGSVTIYNKWLFRNDDILRIGINENGKVMITYLVDALYKKTK